MVCPPWLKKWGGGGHVPPPSIPHQIAPMPISPYDPNVMFFHPLVSKIWARTDQNSQFVVENQHTFRLLKHNHLLHVSDHILFNKLRVILHETARECESDSETDREVGRETARDRVRDKRERDR